MFLRICDLILEKIYNKTVRWAYKTVKVAVQIFNRIYCLNTDFNAIKPRLDNTRNIPKLKSKVKINYSLLAQIDIIIHYIIISLFYFKLDSLPKRHNRKYIITRYILC